MPSSGRWHAPRKEVSEWLQSLYASKGGGYTGPAALGKALHDRFGWGKNIVSQTETQQVIYEGLLVADIAVLTGINALEGFVAAGWITEGDLPDGEVLTLEEQALLQMYRETRPDLRSGIVAALREFHGISRGDTE